MAVVLLNMYTPVRLCQRITHTLIDQTTYFTIAKTPNVNTNANFCLCAGVFGNVEIVPLKECISRTRWCVLWTRSVYTLKDRRESNDLPFT